MGLPRYAWGIDVGNRALKAVKLVRDGDKLRIDDYEVIEHEQILSQAGDNRESLIQSALANFAQRHPYKGGAVAISVSGQSSFARFIKLPPVPPGRIGEIVKFEALQQIPFPLDEVEWSWQAFQAADSPEVEVGLFAIKRELVNAHIRHFTDAGIEVTAVQMSPLAVYNGLYHDQRLEGASLIIDIGAENSDLLISENETIWMRSIPIGGNNFTEALVKAFQLKFPRAEELKRNAATSKYGRQILQAMKPVFADLVSEIQRSIGFYASTHRESRITRVLALGGTFRLPGLQKYLQQNLQLEVVRIDRLQTPVAPDARFAARFNENILSSLGAYGLALQAMEDARIKSSLLPEKIRRERMWREKTRWFAAAAALFVIGTGIPLGNLFAQRQRLQSQEALQKDIARDTSLAQALDRKWKEIETSGNEERQQIVNYLAMLSHREVNISLVDELGKAFPPPDDTKKPRPQRNTVTLAAWNMQYEPDIGQYLGPQVNDEQFNTHAVKLDIAQANGHGQQSAPYNPAGGNGQGNFGPQGPTRRGYFITLLCRTPNANPTPLVNDTIVKYLRERTQAAHNPPSHFSVERVTIPSKVRVSTAYPGGLSHPKPPPLVFNPPATAGETQQPGYNPSESALGGQGGATAEEDKFADDATPGESMKDDSLVTVLAAVTIDPPLVPHPGDGQGNFQPR